MKKYYTLAELSYHDHSVNLADMLHKLVHDTENGAYIFVNNVDNEKLFTDGGFLRIPRDVLQRMEIAAIKARNVFLYRVEIFHLLLTTMDKRWKQYLFDEDLNEESVNDFDLRYFKNLTTDMPSYYISKTPFERYKHSNSTKTSKLITVDDIFVKSGSALVNDVLQKNKVTSLDHLSAEHQAIIIELVALVGMEKVANLRNILDKEWDHYSTELNVALDLHESLFIKKEGNQNEGKIPRACNLLHEKRPDVNPKKNLKNPKEYNAATQRIATLVNSDKK